MPVMWFTCAKNIWSDAIGTMPGRMKLGGNVSVVAGVHVEKLPMRKAPPAVKAQPNQVFLVTYPAVDSS
jgi:hypothetical protein